MKTAHLIKDGTNKGDWNGRAELYELSEAVPYNKGGRKRSTKFVIASSVANAWAVETLVFPADKGGNVLDWSELAGRRGQCTHREALHLLGFELRKA
jgi:hypothetical protein